MLSDFISHSGIYGIVAEMDGRVVGSNFLDERSRIAGVGPITVDPTIQNRAVGKDLMKNVMDRVQTQNFPGVRLVQAAYHNRSLSLYSKLGFNVQVPLVTMQGAPLNLSIEGYAVRTATENDIVQCNELCQIVHGHDRAGEISDAVSQQTATVVEYENRIVGYSTALSFFGHSVAESNDGLKALIAAADEFQGPGILVPATNTDLFRWCLEHGLRVVQVMILMSIGLYNQPQGAYLASVGY
jgi:N-acetylglutamate synthase-like GNAT family acetyltransferase